MGNQSQLILSKQTASAQMVYNLIIFCNKLAEQRVKNTSSSLQQGVNLWGGTQDSFALFYQY